MGSPTEFQRTVESLDRQGHRLLARSEPHRQRTGMRAREIEVKAALHAANLKRQLPQLAKAAENAPDDDSRAAAEREYLTAIQNHHRCHQAYQIARRQRAIAANL